MERSLRLTAVLTSAAIAAAACSSSTDSADTRPGLTSTTVASVASVAPVTAASETTVETPPPTAAAADTTIDELPETTPAPAATAGPVVTVAPPVPTAGTTVVHVGSGFGGSWMPIAIWNGDGWGAADFAADGSIIDVPPSDFAGVSVASLGLIAPVGGLAYGALDFVCVDDRVGPALDVGVPIAEIAGRPGYSAVAVAADWDVQPRPVDQIGLDAPEYQVLGESIVAAAGADPTGGDVVQVVRADLDGNGVEEVLVTFEKITDGFGSPEDFSLVIARYPTADGAVVDDVLFEFYPDEFYPDEASNVPKVGSAAVIAVADLNGDGVMEVVLRRAFWETSLADVYRFGGGVLTPVAGGGCGL